MTAAPSNMDSLSDSQPNSLWAPFLLTLGAAFVHVRSTISHSGTACLLSTIQQHIRAAESSTPDVPSFRDALLQQAGADEKTSQQLQRHFQYADRLCYGRVSPVNSEEVRAYMPVFSIAVDEILHLVANGRKQQASDLIDAVHALPDALLNERWNARAYWGGYLHNYSRKWKSAVFAEVEQAVAVYWKDEEDERVRRDGHLWWKNRWALPAGILICLVIVSTYPPITALARTTIPILLYSHIARIVFLLLCLIFAVTYTPISSSIVRFFAKRGVAPAVRWLLLLNHRQLHSLKCPLLHEAILGGSARVVEIMLQYGADPNQPNPALMTALHYAAGKGDVGIIDLLYHYGAKPHPGPIARTPLHYAALMGSEEAVDILLQHDSQQLQSRDCHGMTPLFLAANHGHIRVIEQLCLAGADVNAENRWHETPLFLASNQEVVEALLRFGADMTHRDWQGHTVIERQIANGDAGFAEGVQEHYTGTQELDDK